MNTPETLQGLLEAMASARRIYLLAENESTYVVSLVGHQFRLAGVQAVVISGGRRERSLALLGAGESDMAVALAIDPAASAELMATIRAVQRRGVRTFAIVRSHSSAAARTADQALIAPQSAGEKGPLTQYAAAVALLNGVAQALALRRAEQVSAILKDLQTWWDGLAES